MNNEWIKNLKAGDMVIISNRYGQSLRKVDKITPAGFVRVNSFLFNQDGRERGGNTWERSYLREATPELIQELREKETIKKAYNLMKNKTNINLEQAKKIIEILGENAE